MFDDRQSFSKNFDKKSLMKSTMLCRNGSVVDERLRRMLNVDTNVRLTNDANEWYFDNNSEKRITGEKRRNISKIRKLQSK